ncbi:MAG: VWA domain-containing protein [Opitutales bacterium]|nr:VWA domain-containing protein [Opitutales bacterium]
MSFDFAHPEYFLLLLFIPLALWGLVSRRRKRPGLLFPATARAADAAKAQGKSHALFWLCTLRTLVIALIVTAMAGPRFGSETKEVESSGIDIMLGVDISGSMLAVDMDWKGKRATRLEVVKGVLDDFIEKRPADRIGMIAFAGDPYLVSPLTLEHSWLRGNLRRIQVGSVIPNGTSVGPPLGMATNRLMQSKDSKSRIVIMLTDGRDEPVPPISPVKYAEAAAALGVKVYTVAVGTDGRVPSYMLARDGKTIARDSLGRPEIGYMQSSLDEDTLEAIATKGGGRFFRARDSDELKRIYEEIDQLEKSEVKLTYRTEYDDAWLMPLCIAFVLFMFEQALASSFLRALP